MSKPKDDRDGVRQVIDGLIKDGWVLDFVYDTEDHITVETVDEAMDAIFAVDIAHLHVRTTNREFNRGWVFFVLGNEPEEVVADHTVNLSPAIDPIVHGWWF